MSSIIYRFFFIGVIFKYATITIINIANVLLYTSPNLVCVSNMVLIQMKFILIVKYNKPVNIQSCFYQ